MEYFTCDDGRRLRIIPGFRQRALTYRKSVTPKTGWSEEEFAVSADKRINRNRRIIEAINSHSGQMADLRILELGCGDGLNAILLAAGGAKQVTGIDLDIRFEKSDERGMNIVRLMNMVSRKICGLDSYEDCFKTYPIELKTMDATSTEFPDDSFDQILSFSVLEHIHPLEKLQDELYRVLAPGGMVYHEIDPFYWLRGCHKRALVDIPWAHARMSLDEFRRFVNETEDESTAQKRYDRLATLNRLTVAQWKAFFKEGPFEIAEWQIKHSPFALEVLQEYPDAAETLPQGIIADDLTIFRILIWLRKPE